MYSSDTTKRSAIHVISTVTPWTDTIEIQDLLSDAATTTQKKQTPHHSNLATQLRIRGATAKR